MEAAERHGIAVMLSIQNHGAFRRSEFGVGGQSGQRGERRTASPCRPRSSPIPLRANCSSAACVTLVARWGYATNLLAWELWNELDRVGKGPAVEACTSRWRTRCATSIPTTT